MFKINVQRTDEETGELILEVELPEAYKHGIGNVRLSDEKVESILDEMGIKRGKWKRPRNLGNRPPKFNRFETLVFEPIAKKAPVAKKSTIVKKTPAKKYEKKVDNSSESVIIKKKNTTHRKKAGG